MRRAGHRGARIDCHVYVWPSDARVVISDIYGTITRSDVMGHVMTAVGRDWTHPGVASLYRKVAAQGYRLLYLSSRSIAQAASTRDFLQDLRQPGAKAHGVACGDGESHALPAGPVILSPDGLFRSVAREVVLRRPYEFKIAALDTIRLLFPDQEGAPAGPPEGGRPPEGARSPFHAGFGNRDTDVRSYVAVGVARSRIFTIDPRSALRQASAPDACPPLACRSLAALLEHVEDIFPNTVDAGAAREAALEAAAVLEAAGVGGDPGGGGGGASGGSARPGGRSLPSARSLLPAGGSAGPGAATDERFSSAVFWRVPPDPAELEGLEGF